MLDTFLVQLGLATLGAIILYIAYALFAHCLSHILASLEKRP